MKSLLETQIFKLHKTRVADDTSRNSVPQKTGNKRKKKKKTKKIKNIKRKIVKRQKTVLFRSHLSRTSPFLLFLKLLFMKFFFGDIKM